jgi:RNA polymerase sigma-70 factor (ECF subfamily)
MASNLKKELLALIPSLRAFAFCLTQDLFKADDLVHSALIEIWCKQAANRDRNLKTAAFSVVHNRYMQTSFAGELSMGALSQKWFAASDDTFAVAFSHLPRTAREAISLVEVWGFNSEQAAEICGCGAETIMHNISNVKRSCSQVNARASFYLLDSEY